MSSASIDPFRGSVGCPHQSQIDDLERVEAETAQIVMDRARKLGWRGRGVPRRVRAALGADLGDDDKVVGIGMQRLPDQLVRDVGTVIVAGVDVIDPARDRLAQHPNCAVGVLRRPEYARAGELHGAIAEAVHEPVAERKRSGFADVDHGSPLLRDRHRI